MLKYRHFIKIALLVVAVGSVLMAILSFIGVAYPNTRDLPVNCKELSLSRSVSVECNKEILHIQKPVSAPKALCYDNDSYVPCIDLAKELLSSKQILVVSVLVFALSTLALRVVFLKRFNK